MYLLEGEIRCCEIHNRFFCLSSINKLKKKLQTCSHYTTTAAFGNGFVISNLIFSIPLEKYQPIRVALGWVPNTSLAPKMTNQTLKWAGCPRREHTPGEVLRLGGGRGLLRGHPPPTQTGQ